MHIFIIILIATSIAYLAETLFLYYGLKHLKNDQINKTSNLRFSVIIAAHNEEKNILNCLRSVLIQSIPAERFEVILVNDRSSDLTATIVKSVMAQHPNLSTITIIKTPSGISPKKHAVAQGIAQAKNEVIVFTDADCVVKPAWLETIGSYLGPNVGFVQGITNYSYLPGMSKMFFNLQAIDFLSHGIVSAAAIGANFPLNSNANNLAFKKEAFDAVGGYGALSRVVSGDDDLLLQRIWKSKIWKIRYMTDERGTVETQPAPTPRSLFEQRKRWGSKTVHYNVRQIAFLGVIFSFYCLIVACFFASLCWSAFWPILGALLAVKCVGELMLMWPGTQMFNKKELRGYIFPETFIQVPLVVISVVLGVFGKFGWKDQTFSRTVKPK